MSYFAITLTIFIGVLVMTLGLFALIVLGVVGTLTIAPWILCVFIFVLLFLLLVVAVLNYVLKDAIDERRRNKR